MRRLTAFLLVVVLVAVSGVLAQQPTEQEELDKKVKEIQKDIARIRGKDFKKDVSVGVKDAEELKKFLLDEMEKESPDEEIRKSQKVLEKFGLIEKETDLKKVLVDVCIEQVAGFYNPDTKELFLIKGKGFKARPGDEDIATAHELTHALQDQHFDLRYFTKSVRNDDDRSLALQCVVEGEATLLGFDYFFRKTQGKSVKDFQRDIGQFMKAQAEIAARLRADSALNKAPAIIREMLLFPYTNGASFSQQVLRRNDWKGFDRVFENPPQSTEQVLHPEKYFETIDYPTSLSTPELLKQLEGEWQLLDNNSVGEFGISILVSQFLTAEDAKKASEGWDGDKYQAIEEKKTGRIVIAWVTTWDTKDDAQEFARIYTSVLEKKYGKSAQAGQNGSFIFVAGDSELACVEFCGTEVIVVDTASKSQLEKIRPELLKTVKVITEEQKLDEFAKQPFSVPEPPPKEPKKEPQKTPEDNREF